MLISKLDSTISLNTRIIKLNFIKLFVKLFYKLFYKLFFKLFIKLSFKPSFKLHTRVKVSFY